MMGKRFVVCPLLLVGANVLADQNGNQAKLLDLRATMEDQRAHLLAAAKKIGQQCLQ